jgi:hypothetical protein
MIARAIVAFEVVRGSEGLDLGDPRLRHHGAEPLAVAVLATVDQQRHPVGHDE